MDHPTSCTKCSFAVALVLTAFASFFACSSQPRYAAPPVAGGSVTIDTASMQIDVPRFYTYRHEGKDINFFVIRMQDRVVSFIDACVTCAPKKRGYADRDGYVVCRACDMSFSIYKLEKGIGGCYPIKLKGTTDGRTYRIPLSALENMADKF